MKTIAQIAAALEGYDAASMPVPLVHAFISQLVEPVPEVEPVSLREALGRVVALDVISPVDVPPHDNSAMDGYAFDGSQLQRGEPLSLRSIGTALAGQAWRGRVAPGECVRIMTGAVLPPGLDTVVPQELAEAAGDVIRIPAAALQAGANRRRKGEDLRAGEPALRAGERLGPAALGLLASLGLGSVQVRRRVRVAYFSTGDEILSPGESPREGAVYDSNRFSIFGLLTRLGCEVIDLGSIKDEPAALEAALREAASLSDVILTSGGVSGGDADFTRAMMKKLGDVAFWKIAMRPGRPMAVGRIAQGGNPALLFGLPGNPVAVMVAFLAFVRPALLGMMGAREKATPLLRVRAAEPIRKKPGRTEYQRAVVSTATDGSLHVMTTGDQGSGMLSSMVRANGLVVLDHARGDVAAGEEVGVMMFEGVL
ncbi:MAG: gephyrin-like molybdotransferase Glp [Burkholderiaceae bacterium]